MSFDVRKFIDGLDALLTKDFRTINQRHRELDGRVTARLNAHEARLKAIEAQSRELKYLGVWEAGRSYKQHNAVTCSGNLWIARAETTTQKPGDSPDWQLAVRRGKDAAA